MIFPFQTVVAIGVAHFGHWVADFVMQSDDTARKKSSDNRVLADHCITYATILTMGFLYLFSTWQQAGIFFLFILFSHFVTDYFTSRDNKRLWEQKRVHEFFENIGADQFLHFVQMFGALWALGI